MTARFESLRISAAVLAALLGAARAGAQLASVSPFLPVQNAGGVGAPTPGAPLEYRAMIETADGMLFRIVDPARKNAGAFVRLNERDPTLDVIVKQHEGSGDNDTVVVEQAGRTFTLPLRSAKVVSSGSAGQGFVPPPLPPPGQNMPPAITNTVVVNPTPADEQRRLEAVAAEVARRRALREQATQQINQGVPVVPQAVQPMPQQQPAQPQGTQRGPQGNRGNAPPGGPRQRQ